MPPRNTIVISGLIGAGKSTLVQALQDEECTAVKVPEPVDTNPYIDDFYRDPTQYGFRMQAWILQARARLLHEAPLAPWLLLDRCIEEDALFARLLHAQGRIDDRDFAFYDELLAHNRDLAPPVDLIVYLDVSVDTALERIALRGRPCEKAITREYLTSLRTVYEEWLKDKKVIRLDWTRPQSAKEVWAQIKAFTE